MSLRRRRVSFVVIASTGRERERERRGRGGGDDGRGRAAHRRWMPSSRRTMKTRDADECESNVNQLFVSHQRTLARARAGLITGLAIQSDALTHLFTTVISVIDGGEFR